MSSCLSVCPSVRLSSYIGVAPTEQISVKFEIGDFYGLCVENPSLVTIEQKYRAIYLKTYALLFVAGEMFRWKSIVVQDSIFLDRWQWHIAQACADNAVFLLQQWLREVPTMLGFTCVLYLLQIIKPPSFSNRFQPLYNMPNTVKHVHLVTFASRPLVTGGHISRKQKFLW